MAALIDLTGQRFGRWLAIEKSISKCGYVMWLCRCDCGNERIVNGHDLRKGKSKSCGCLRNEVTTNRNITHGKTDCRLYRIWRGMKDRCTNPTNKGYPSYGGRGITICEEWLDNFEAFYAWAMANGYDPNAPRYQCTIDRIDNDGNYSPSNCRWTTMATQNKNKRAKNGLKIKEI